MKTSSFFGIVLGAFLFLTSCQKTDVKMHTIIYGDGTCEREVSYCNVMSKEMRDSVWDKGNNGWSQPVPQCLNVDSTSNSHTEIGAGDTVTTTFSRRFHSVEEMCQQTPLQLNDTRVQSKAKLEKRFRWFYTEYTFIEVFNCVGDTFKIAPTNYADKDIVSYWFTGQPNLIEGLSGAETSQKINEMEPLISKWINDNLFQVGFDFIVNHYDSIPNPPVSREQFVALHDSLARVVTKDFDNLNVSSTETFQSFFHSDAYAFFFDEETPCGKALSQELANHLCIFWFNVPYTLSMPGTITDTGVGTLQPDGTIFYPFTGERLIPHDYVITATSRATNVWAFIVTLFIIVLAIGSFFIRKRKNLTK